jgi:hypothetical protein
MKASFLWAGWEPSDPPMPEENKWNLIRRYRDELLVKCDWTQLGDAPCTAQQKEAWTTYRQALRDIPQNYDKADDVYFPEVAA